MTKELLELLQNDIYTDAPEYADRVKRIKELLGRPYTWATEEQVKAARKIHGNDDVEVDDLDVCISEADDGVWVQGWLWVPDAFMEFVR